MARIGDGLSRQDRGLSPARRRSSGSTGERVFECRGHAGVRPARAHESRRRRRSARRPGPRARGLVCSSCADATRRAGRTGRPGMRLAPVRELAGARLDQAARSSPLTWPGREPAAWGTRTTSAPRARIIRARSRLLPSDMTATKGWPRTAQTIARPRSGVPARELNDGLAGLELAGRERHPR